jgi:hypothetical protein
MPYKMFVAALALAVVCPAVSAQEPAASPVSEWSWGHRLELRGDYRWSDDEQHPTNFPPGGPGLQTVDPGHHFELNVADLELNLGYGEVFAARAIVHAQALHRRNPTSQDRQFDADELWVRIGRKPEFLERPEGTSFFLQAGKFPKMERQPLRLLESYGLAATAFNRFEDLQLLAGGTVGRNFYWRAQVSNGNPLFIRDPNALAGDNGTERRLDNKIPQVNSGFVILYNAETEDLVFDPNNMQLGEAVGYRWQRPDETLGFDAIVFHYNRDLADEVDLTGTQYGGDLDILSVGELDPAVTLPISGRKKEEYGARVYAEWHQATLIAQVTAQEVAGLKREGWELEAGYRLPFALGPIRSIQPALRVSGLETHFHGTRFPAPSVWWEWTKYDAGVRIELPHGLDVTAEYTLHDISAPRRPVGERETLVTVRWRV